MPLVNVLPALRDNQSGLVWSATYNAHGTAALGAAMVSGETIGADYYDVTRFDNLLVHVSGTITSATSWNYRIEWSHALNNTAWVREPKLDLSVANQVNHELAPHRYTANRADVYEARVLGRYVRFIQNQAGAAGGGRIWLRFQAWRTGG